MKPFVHMPVDAEFMNVIREISARSLTEAQWANAESDDEFQTQHYSGGYDALEHAFCFSYYPDNGKEMWFQLSLRELTEIESGVKRTIELREAE